MYIVSKLLSCSPIRGIILALLASCLLVAQGWAQSYPTRSVRMILPFPPGGPTDITGRVIAQKLSEQLGQPVVPDNRPGAAGNIGLELAAKSPPDGYTIVLTAPPIAISPSLYKKLNYDAEKELAPISLVAEIQNIIVSHNSVPVKNLKDLIALAQRNPGKLTFSSSGDVKKRLATSGVEPLVSTPENFAKHIRSEKVRYVKIIKDSGITAQ